MTNQSALLRRDDLKTPAVILFCGVYLAAIGLTFLSDPLQAVIYLGMSLGLVLLVWLVLDLTRKFPVEELQVKRVWLELSFGGLLFLIMQFSPYWELGGRWVLGEILKKELLYFALPLAFLLWRGYSLACLGLAPVNWRANLKLAGIVLACLAIPCIFLIGNTAKLISGGQVGFLQAIPAFLLYFIHNILRSGLPEEFFYRVFLQTRLAVLLKSRLGGILITSILFGLVHIQGSGMPLAEAFCTTFFMQGFMSLIFGVLWDRTRSLLPGVLVHSGINALNSLGAAVALIS